MGRHETEMELTGEERVPLNGWARSPRTEQRMAFRVRIALMAADGMGTGKTAETPHTWPPTVIKWRTHFAEERIGGLQDARRRLHVAAPTLGKPLMRSSKPTTRPPHRSNGPSDTSNPYPWQILMQDYKSRH